MASTPEARFAAKVRDSLPDAYITRIESRVGLGTPDMLVALKNTGQFAMLELKVVTRGLKVKLSPHQISFMLRHASIGCLVYVLVLHKKEGERVGEVLLYSGADADKLVTDGLRVEPLARWPSINIRWNELGYVLSTNKRLE